jgi:hypothetical protein
MNRLSPFFSQGKLPDPCLDIQKHLSGGLAVLQKGSPPFNLGIKEDRSLPIPSLTPHAIRIIKK